MICLRRPTRHYEVIPKASISWTIVYGHSPSGVGCGGRRYETNICRLGAPGTKGNVGRDDWLQKYKNCIVRLLFTQWHKKSMWQLIPNWDAFFAPPNECQPFFSHKPIPFVHTSHVFRQCHQIFRKISLTCLRQYVGSSGHCSPGVPAFKNVCGCPS